MTLHVRHAQVTMDILPPRPGDTGAGTANQPLDERTLRERLRPLVLEILQQEMDQMRRQHG